MGKRPALGKGIDALLPQEKPKVENTSSSTTPINENAEYILNINPKLLKQNPYQPRKTFDDNTIEELALSIKEYGIIQPIVAHKNNDESYFIISGERRTRAALSLGLETVPIIIKNLEDNEKLEIALIENIQRENLNSIEEALAYKQIMDLSNLNHEELAQKVGKSRSAITNSLRLLKLPEDMQEALKESKISAGHARAILSVVNPAEQEILFNKIIEDNLSVRASETLAANYNAGAGRISERSKTRKRQSSETDFELKDIEQQFIEALGTKVQIKGNLEKGSIEISYFSKDDLNSLYEKIKA